MKLTIKEIAPYLPYGLKGNLENLEFYDTVINKELYRVETGKTEVSNVLDVYVIVGSIEGKIEDFKPILRPLSDITKEIEHNGEKFVPIKELGINKMWLGLDDYHLHVNNQPYSEVQKLLEWHFDIYGLIDQNIAVDINTLNK